MNSLIKVGIWIIVILIVTFLFPKSCEFDNKEVKNTCIGMTLPFESESKSGELYGWCSGYCKIEVIKETPPPNSTLMDVPDDSPAAISPIFESFKKTLPILLIIAIIIAIIATFQSVIERSRVN